MNGLDRGSRLAWGGYALTLLNRAPIGKGEGDQKGMQSHLRSGQVVADERGIGKAGQKRRRFNKRIESAATLTMNRILTILPASTPPLLSLSMPLPALADKDSGRGCG